MVFDIFQLQTIRAVSQRIKESPGQQAALSAEEASDTVPLSYSQERYITIDTANANDINHNLGVGMLLRGPLNLDALKEAVSLTIEAQPVLRSVFYTFPGEQGLRLLPVKKTPRLEEVVLNLGNKEKHDFGDVFEVVRQEMLKPFNLLKGPLFRPRYLRLSSVETLLFYSVHHAIFDAWSEKILHTTLEKFYNAISENKAYEKAEVPFGLSARYQRWFVGTKEGKRQLAFWLDKLTRFEQDSGFPSSNGCFSHGERILKVETEIADAVPRTIADLQTTKFSFFLSIYLLALRLNWGIERQIIGCPTLKRAGAKMELEINNVADTSLFCISTARCSTFRDIVKRVQGEVKEVLMNEDITHPYLMENLQPQFGKNYKPIYNFRFAYQYEGSYLPSLKNLVAQGVGIKMGSGGSTRHLSLYVVESSNNFMAKLNYNAALFSEADADEFGQKYLEVLAAVTYDPSVKIDHILATHK